MDPYTDEDIESLLHQEPINDFRHPEPEQDVSGVWMLEPEPIEQPEYVTQ